MFWPCLVFPNSCCFPPNLRGREAQLSPELLWPSRKVPGGGLASNCGGKAAIWCLPLPDSPWLLDWELGLSKYAMRDFYHPKRIFCSGKLRFWSMGVWGHPRFRQNWWCDSCSMTPPKSEPSVAVTLDWGDLTMNLRKYAVTWFGFFFPIPFTSVYYM